MQNKEQRKLDCKFYEQAKHKILLDIIRHKFFKYLLNYGNQKYLPKKDTQLHRYL